MLHIIETLSKIHETVGFKTWNDFKAKLFTGLKDENINYSRDHNDPITGHPVLPKKFIWSMFYYYKYE